MNKPHKTCLNHPERLARAKSLCGSCYHRYLDEIAEPSVREARLLRRREYRKGKKADPIARHARRLKHRYGLTVAEYKQMCQEQNNSCAICQRQPKTLYVDHDHRTKKVRQLLCPPCNTMLGGLESRYNLEGVKYLYLHNSDALARLELLLKGGRDAIHQD